MNRKNVIVAATAAFAVLSLIIIFKDHLRPEKKSSYISEQERLKGPCPGKTETLVAKDPAMSALLPEGTKFHMIENWYACKPVERGDLVMYRYSFQRDPVVRQVVGVPGDKFELVEDKVHHSWNLLVNGKLILDKDKEAHYFGALGRPSVLSLYAKNGKGTLNPKNSIVFNKTSPSQLDSGMFGVVNVDDFLGKVELIQ